MLTIHGRTRCQFYKGHADWEAIRHVVEAVSIPVLANGDITDPEQARAALAVSGAAGVMVGRGAQGRPWALAEIAAGLGHGAEPCVPRGADFATLVIRHYGAILNFYGTALGGRVARKHLGWYMDEAATSPERRRAILTAPPEAVADLLSETLAAPARRAA